MFYSWRALLSNPFFYARTRAEKAKDAFPRTVPRKEKTPRGAFPPIPQNPLGLFAEKSFYFPHLWFS